jgi:hypothetical protein
MHTYIHMFIYTYRLDTNIVYPDGPDKCIVEFEWYHDTDGDNNSQVNMYIYLDVCVQSICVCIYAYMYVYSLIRVVL